MCSIQHLWPATDSQSHPNWFPDSKGRMGTSLVPRPRLGWVMPGNEARWESDSQLECNDIVDIVATTVSSVTLETCRALH